MIPIPEQDVHAVLLWKCNLHATYGITAFDRGWWRLLPVERASWRRTAAAYDELMARERGNDV